ncbi:hypothetical protein E0485_08550 [Paenibacillus albiflavus]|uniref:Peptidase A4 family protein n=2 Tax=Paenibacillus albiflavus TaxID=2545760 RepID=A0A4R4EJ96_9BACL|nr:hypothetical protein E0485_08550 [Paenibacillus albiflavus]
MLPTVLPGWQSGNWSGYAIKKTKSNSFRSISCYWIVPRVKASKQNKYSSIWIGIDGFNNSSLIQTGTEQDIVKGKAVYYPWWEILPAPETRIPNSVSPNDLMYAKISKLSNSKWQIVLKNKTKGWTFRTIRKYTGPANTAEWIMEAPTINNNTARLADYRKMGFKKCRVNNKNPILQRSDRGVMVQKGRVVSTPSLLNKSRDGFTVTYG